MATRSDALLVKKRVEKAALQLYLKQGIEATTNKELAGAAQVSASSLNNFYRTKEDLLLFCFDFISGKEREFFDGVLKDKDKCIAYCTETAVELYMCENDAALKDVFSQAYSLPKTMEYIKSNYYKKSEQTFTAHLSGWTEHDFYEAEITRSGIMFGYIMESSNPYFTHEHKIKRCLTSILKLFEYSAAEREEIIKKVLEEDIKSYSEKFVAYLMNAVTQI